MDLHPRPLHDDTDLDATTLTAAPGFGRRHALKLMAAGAGLLTLAACGGSSPDDTGTASGSTATSTTTPGSTTSTASSTASTATTASSTSSSGAAEETIPEETGGPYPGDGSNGPNVLTQDGVVRRDITTSIGAASGTADGVPLTITLTVHDGADGSPLTGGAVYLWHCTREGGYSMYSNGITNENYLRGVQEIDANGQVTFTSIFPGAYSGRWPHIHFKVYSSVDDATGGGKAVVTSQLALPEDVCDVVYASDGYSASVRNLASTSLERDNVFSDGHDLQLAAATGSVAAGYAATLTMAV